MLSSARWRRNRAARESSVCQETVRPLSIARCPSASMKCDLPASARAADDEDFGTVDPFEGPQRVLCLGGDHRGGRLPSVERLAGRQTRGASAHRDGRVVAAGGLLGEQDTQDLGVFPALRWSRSRSPPAPLGEHRACRRRLQQSVELVGQRWRGGRLDGHGSSPIVVVELVCGRRIGRGTIAQGRRTALSASITRASGKIGAFIVRILPSCGSSAAASGSPGRAGERDHGR